MSAVVAPVMDIFRPTRKNNIIGNGRPNGNATAPHSGEEKTKSRPRAVTVRAASDEEQQDTEGPKEV